MKKPKRRTLLVILIVSASIIALGTFVGCNFLTPGDNGNTLDELNKMLVPDTLPSGAEVSTHEERVALEQKRIADETALHQQNGPSRSLTNGTFSFDENIDVSKDMTGVVIYDNSYAKAEITGGGITFTPGFHFDATISNGSLQSAKAYIYNTATATARYKVTLKASYTNSYARNLYSWSQTYFSLIAGWVPAWVTFNIQIDGGNYFNTTATGWVAAGLWVQSYVQIGAQWTSSGGWSNISSSNPSWGYYAPTFGYSASLTIQPYVNVFLSAYLYSILGPRCLVTPYMTMYVNSNRTYSLYGNLRGHIYFDLQGLEKYTIWDKDVFNVSRLLVSGSF